MKWGRRINLIVCVLLVLVGMSGQAQTPQPFSADVSFNSGHGTTMMGKWYFSPPKMRMDMAAPAQQKANPMGNVSMIIDPVAKNSFMLMPQHQMYMEIPIGSGGDMEGMQRLQNISHGSEPCAGQTGMTCKKVGVEAVNGRNCDKWETTEKDGHTTTAWIDQKLHFPIKVQDDKGDTTSFTNIKEGPQDPSLFVVPPGYRKFDASAFGRPK